MTVKVAKVWESEHLSVAPQQPQPQATKK